MKKGADATETAKPFLQTATGLAVTGLALFATVWVVAKAWKFGTKTA